MITQERQERFTSHAGDFQVLPALRLNKVFDVQERRDAHGRWAKVADFVSANYREVYPETARGSVFITPEGRIHWVPSHAIAISQILEHETGALSVRFSDENMRQGMDDYNLLRVQNYEGRGSLECNVETASDHVTGAQLDALHDLYEADQQVPNKVTNLYYDIRAPGGGSPKVKQTPFRYQTLRTFVSDLKANGYLADPDWVAKAVNPEKSRDDDKSEGVWRTLRGVHVFIKPDGTIGKGPSDLTGKNITHLPPSDFAHLHNQGPVTQSPGKAEDLDAVDFGEGPDSGGKNRGSRVAGVVWRHAWDQKAKITSTKDAQVFLDKLVKAHPKSSLAHYAQTLTKDEKHWYDSTVRQLIKRFGDPAAGGDGDGEGKGGGGDDKVTPPPPPPPPPPVVKPDEKPDEKPSRRGKLTPSDRDSLEYKMFEAMKRQADGAGITVRDANHALSILSVASTQDKDQGVIKDWLNTATADQLARFKSIVQAELPVKRLTSALNNPYKERPAVTPQRGRVRSMAEAAWRMRDLTKGGGGRKFAVGDKVVTGDGKHGVVEKPSAYGGRYIGVRVAGQKALDYAAPDYITYEDGSGGPALKNDDFDTVIDSLRINHDLDPDLARWLDNNLGATSRTERSGMRDVLERDYALSGLRNVSRPDFGKAESSSVAGLSPALAAIRQKADEIGSAKDAINVGLQVKAEISRRMRVGSEAEIAAARERYYALDHEYHALTKDLDPRKAVTPAFAAKLDQLAGEWHAANEAYDKIRRGQSLPEATQAVLHDLADFGLPKNGLSRLLGDAGFKPILGLKDTKATPETNAAAEKILVQGAEFLPTEWLEESNANTDAPLRIYGDPGIRAYHAWNGSVHLDPSKYGGDSPAVAAHELGHHIEEINRHILSWEKEWYYSRVGSEDNAWLGPPYDKTEVGRRDRFSNVYIGKSYNDQAFEILSMGFTAMHEKRYDDIFSKDPNFEAFVLGMLASAPRRAKAGEATPPPAPLPSEVAKKTARRRTAKAYDPDESRDEAGRWTAGAGGEGEPGKPEDLDHLDLGPAPWENGWKNRGSKVAGIVWRHAYAQGKKLTSTEEARKFLTDLVYQHALNQGLDHYLVTHNAVERHWFDSTMRKLIKDDADAPPPKPQPARRRTPLERSDPNLMLSKKDLETTEDYIFHELWDSVRWNDDADKLETPRDGLDLLKKYKPTYEVTNWLQTSTPEQVARFDRIFRAYFEMGPAAKPLVNPYSKYVAPEDKIAPTVSSFKGLTPRQAVIRTKADHIHTWQDAVSVGKDIMEEAAWQKSPAGDLFRAYEKAEAEANQMDVDYRALLKRLARPEVSFEEYSTQSKAASKKLQAAFTRSVKLANQVRVEYESLWSTLGKITDLGPPKEGVRVWSSAQSGGITLAKEALQYIPTEWLQASNARGTVMVTKSKGISRAFYRDSDGEIHFGKDTTLATAAHEWGHRAEYSVPKLLKMEQEFYDYRTKGEPLEDLGPPYDPGEKTRRDKFTNAYIGKDYEGRAFELITMGFSALVKGERYYESIPDEEYMQFILGCLASAKRR